MLRCKGRAGKVSQSGSRKRGPVGRGRGQQALLAQEGGFSLGYLSYIAAANPCASVAVTVH